MVRVILKSAASSLGALLCACALVASQSSPPDSLIDSGQVVVNGHRTSYLIRHLPVNAFPQLPSAVQNALTRRGCLIPQTYEAHGPENVVHASLERRGSSDWAVLCSANSAVSLLVFFSSNYADPTILASAPETERLQSHGSSNVLGFDWAIDPASPEEVHEAQLGMRYPPPRLAHDALADSVIDQRTIYHFYSSNAWTLIDTED
ncbi:MAG: hypothetical protein ABSC62_10195 [Terracidiphilus sp.]|jgi:hypothetical protein